MKLEKILNLFENPGEKIMLLAKISACLLVIAGFVVGLVLAIEIEDAAFFLLIFPGSVIIAALSGLSLYAFGALVESSEANERNTREILLMLRREKAGDSVSAPSAPAAPKKEEKTRKPVAPIALENGFEQCPACQTVQYAGRKICSVCSSPFVRKPLSDPKPVQTESGKAAAPESVSDKEEGAEKAPQKAAAPELPKDNVSSAVQYALRFKTEEGMIRYLRSCGDTLSANERAELNALLSGPEETLRQRLRQRIGDGSAAGE